MNYYERPTPLQEQAYTEARQQFAEHLKQFKANSDTLHNIEANLSVTANDVSRAARQASGRIIQTDDGTQWQHDVDLTRITSVCHRHTPAGLEFAVVKCLPLKSGKMKDILTRGNNATEVLQQFARDQRQVFKIWKDDLTTQVREHLAEKYPHQDMSIVAESFEIKLTRIADALELLNVGAGTKGDGCEFKRGQVWCGVEPSLGRGVAEA
mgnify:CR=1 FL=1